MRDGADLLVAWERHAGEAVIPWVATAPDSPRDIDSNDELYLTAVHLTQNRHPTRSPQSYLEEALRRDPSDTRSATALAMRHLLHGEYDAADRLLTAATARLTRRNLNPRDGETSYLHGLVLERRGEHARADASFAKSAWNAAWTAPASLARARLALRADRPDDAVVLAARAGTIPEAYRVTILARRRQQRADDAAALLRARREADPLDAATAVLDNALDTLDPRTALEVAAEFARAGAWAEALAATRDPHPDVDGSIGFTNAEPLRHYLRAMWLDAAGRPADADDERHKARSSRGDYAFPAGLNEYDALRAALAADPADHRAHGLLGMWLLDAARTEDALVHLTAATDAGSPEPVVWRNLALATVESGGDRQLADAAFVRALALRRDARLVFERDQLAQVRGIAPAGRLALLEEYQDVLDERDDLALVRVTLLLDVGRWSEAWEILCTRVFRPFEGGEGRVIAAFDRASCAIARDLIDTDPSAAARLLRDGHHAPANLGEGRHPAFPVAERLVLQGDALQSMGDQEGARRAWGDARATSPLAVDDRPARAADYWVGVAHLRLGEHEKAEKIWARLTARADALEQTKDAVDYFATSVPELLLFDTDTAGARAEEARTLRALASAGRAATLNV